jgi:hypothetical protein
MDAGDGSEDEDDLLYFLALIGAAARIEGAYGP